MRRCWPAPSSCSAGSSSLPRGSGRSSRDPARSGAEAMVRLADIGVSRKVLAILVASLLPTIAVGAFGLVKLAEVNANSAQIRDNWLPSTRFLGDLNNYMSDYRT